jgi:5-methylcytosine-specific restriction endonuclease McrA
MPYRSRLNDLKYGILDIAKDYDQAKEDSTIGENEYIAFKEDLATILSYIYDIDENDKSIYNTAYRAGWRVATIWHLGGRCEECGEDDIAELEIDHIDGEGVVSVEGRGPEDWKDLNVLRLLCKRCHAKTPNYKINKRYMK